MTIAVAPGGIGRGLKMKQRERIGISGVVLLVGCAVCVVSPAADTGAPGAQQLCPRRTLTLQLDTPLTFSNSLTLPRFTIPDEREEIYGIAFDVRSAVPCMVRPSWIRLFDRAGETVRELWIDYRYGDLPVASGPGWQTGRVEFMAKRNVAQIELQLWAAGRQQVELRNVRLICGGFAPDSVFAPAPYLPWIESLRAGRAYAQATPLVDVKITPAEKRRISIWFDWLPDIILAPETVEYLEDAISTYMALPLPELIALMPARRPFAFDYNSCKKRRFSWDPRTPDVITRADGTVFDFAAKYPVTGREKAVAPNGKVTDYPYHEPEKADARYGRYTVGNRIYLDQFLTTVKCRELCRTAYTMAVLARTTGKQEYALRSAAILWALSRRIPDWPVFGRKGQEPVRFLSPDSYDDWMAFVLSFVSIDDHNEAGWYTVATSKLSWLARNFDLIKNTPVWQALSAHTSPDPRADIENALLYVAQRSLKRDASLRYSPWMLYHNTTPGQIRGLMDVGRAVGCPELVHYGVNKARAILQHALMADGMFPESVSYLHDLIGSFRTIFEHFDGYSDPPGYVSKLDGVRFDRFDADSELPLFGSARGLLDRLRFPDGTLLSVHDTWSYTTSPVPAKWLKEYERSPTDSLLLPDFGHAVQGWGAAPNWIETHLHYSGCHNHGHLDMLNLTLWAYGDELVSDLGYTHLGAYPCETPSHNLVVIDGCNQEQYLVQRGDLLVWFATRGAAQVMQAAQDRNPAYNSAQRYRRGVVTIPFAPGRDAIVDFFEVTGGSRHEWMANGCADYAQTVETNLNQTDVLDNLAENGGATTRPVRIKARISEIAGKKALHYGAFRHARRCSNAKPWQVTMTAAPPVAADTPGAGPRAYSRETKPGLRLHWIAPRDGEVFLAEAPRNRYSGEHHHKEEAIKAWADRRMPKIIVRRDGRYLDSTFVAVWEPFLQAPWLAEVAALPAINPEDGLGVLLRGEHGQAKVLYRRPESAARLVVNGFASDAQFAVLRDYGDDRHAVDVYQGAHVVAGDVTAQLSPWPSLPVIGQGEEHGAPYLLVEGALDGYPTDPEKQPHAGGFVKFVQESHASWWLPLQRLEKNEDGACRLYLARTIGFAYDARLERLQERFYPFRTLSGKAAVVLPSTMNLEWGDLAGDQVQLRLRLTANARLTLAGVPDAEAVRMRPRAAATWMPLAAQQHADTLALEVSTGLIGRGWADLIISKR